MSRVYQLVYGDPPWNYTNKKTGGSMSSGAAQKYPCLPTKDIIALRPPVDRCAVLFLWVTVPFLPDGLEVLRGWGFAYKTMHTWHKVGGRPGTGFWFRGETEHLLFGIRGKVPAFRAMVPNHYSHPALGHSEKPPYFRQMAEATTRLAFAEPPKLEMFARHATPGWDVFGNEVPDSITINPAP